MRSYEYNIVNENGGVVYRERIKSGVKSGISFGSCLAMVISYVTWNSIPWAIFHGLLGFSRGGYYQSFVILQCLEPALDIGGRVAEAAVCFQSQHIYKHCRAHFRNQFFFAILFIAERCCFADSVQS